MKNKTYLLVSVLLLVILLNFDFTAVNLVLPNLITDFQSNLQQVQWVISIYFIMASITFIPAGFLSDRYGNEIIYVIGLIIFICSSIMILISKVFILLIFSRMLEGIGFGLSFNSGLLLAKNNEVKEKQAFIIGLIVGVASITQAIGPFIGSLLTHIYSWKGIFAINIPLSLLSLLLFYLGNNNLNIVKSYNTPISNYYNSIKYINKRFLFACISRAIYNICFYSMLFLFPIYLQNLENIPIIKTGIYILLINLLTGIFCIASARLINIFGPLIVMRLGIILIIIANILFIFIATQMCFIFSFFLYGISSAFFIAAVTKYALQNIYVEIEGKCMGLFYTLSLISSAISYLITGFVMHSSSAYLLRKNYSYQKDLLHYLLNYASGSEALRSIKTNMIIYKPVVQHIFLISMKNLLIFETLFILVVFILTLNRQYVSNHKLRNSI